jgi:hypothetical protein
LGLSPLSLAPSPRALCPPDWTSDEIIEEELEKWKACKGRYQTQQPEIFKEIREHPLFSMVDLFSLMLLMSLQACFLKKILFFQKISVSPHVRCTKKSLIIYTLVTDAAGQSFQSIVDSQRLDCDEGLRREEG